ncbi:hypothetical protein R1sor_007413 [Riccia sorocarpa]|uniref:Laccase n=1 Tax=Riccia sorocarpa TaxID=122646 RepID=A0ABD3HTV5_9MARC
MMGARNVAVQQILYVLLTISCFAVLSNAGVRDDLEATYDGPTTRYYDWTVESATVTVNCVTVPRIVVNGEFPGPPIYAVEGDRIVINVTNKANTDVSIHWHGVRQILSNWHDGVPYITECPLKQGEYFVYNFTVENQQGTVFWHAHINWLRATVVGALIVYPRNFTYPYPKPDEEFTVLLGEWWNRDPNAVEIAGVKTGQGFQVADALLINGKPGSLYNCSDAEGISTFKVQSGKTYLLRVINAGLNTETFLGIANHTQTVVSADGEYVKPKDINTSFISPGQTLDVLITADQEPGTYYMETKSYSSIMITDTTVLPPIAIMSLRNDDPKIPASAIFQYDTSPPLDPSHTFFPALPEENDTDPTFRFLDSLRTIYPDQVPAQATRKQFFTVGLAAQPCNTSFQNCTFATVAQINNITWVEPEISILKAYYFGIEGVYKTNFPDIPLRFFDFTNADSPDAPGRVSELGTRVSVIKYGTVIDLVLQGMNNLLFQNHPFHLHGHSFWVLGRGMGNFDPNTSPSGLNYHDPPFRFTVDVPSRGWVAIRWKANNPGAWYFHCHLEKHTTWGMMMAFIVLNGDGPDETLPPPPEHLTPCLT